MASTFFFIVSMPKVFLLSPEEKINVFFFFFKLLRSSVFTKCGLLSHRHRNYPKTYLKCRFLSQVLSQELAFLTNIPVILVLTNKVGKELMRSKIVAVPLLILSAHALESLPVPRGPISTQSSLKKKKKKRKCPAFLVNVIGIPPLANLNDPDLLMRELSEGCKTLMNRMRGSGSPDLRSFNSNHCG